MEPAKTRGICVIGIGNEFRGDDAIGLLAARKLKKRALSGISVIELDGESTALMSAMTNRTVVILIDAMLSGAKVGTITRFDAGTNPIPAAGFRCSTHAISVGDAIELARILDRLPQHVIVYGIEGACFEPGNSVTPELASALNETVERVSNEIRSLQAKLGASL